MAEPKYVHGFGKGRISAKRGGRYVLLDGEWVSRDQLRASRARRAGNRAPMTRPPWKRHFSYIHGRQLNSWAEYHAANKELDLVDVGRPPGQPETPEVFKAKIPEHALGRHCERVAPEDE